MSRLKNIIRRLDENDYRILEQSLLESRAESLHFVLRAYRESELSDHDIALQLKTSIANIYVLRSRLSDRIQQELSGDVSNDAIAVVAQLQRIHSICFETPREVAQTMLEKLEADLRKSDLHNELLLVYSALKKINLHTDAYFRYSQLYNRHAAFHLALEKCEELLVTFNRTLSEYELSRDPDIPPRLQFLVKELDDHRRLNPTRQVDILCSIAQVQNILFAGEEGDAAIMLEEMQRAFADLPEATVHKKWEPVLDFLWFEYWLKENRVRRAAPFYERLAGRVPTLLLFSPICVTSIFPLSRIKYLLASGQPEALTDDVCAEALADPEDRLAQTTKNIATALADYYKGKSRDAATRLNGLLNSYGYKDQLHAQVEIKLLLAFMYLCAQEHDLLQGTLRSLSRKLKDLPGRYTHVGALIKVLQAALTSGQPGEKQSVYMKSFLHDNRGAEAVLTYFEPELRKKFLNEDLR